MSESNDTSDLELLELYLDRELDADAASRLETRLTSESALRARLDRLRRTRSVRLAAMSTAFDTDAASVERLVASVRDARAAEIAEGNRSRWRIVPSQASSYLAAAACLACGLFVGAELQRQQNGSLGGRVDTPTVRVGGAGIENASFNLAGGSNGAYVVSLLGADGRERVKFRFYSAEQARQFVGLMRQKAAASGQAVPNLGDARIDSDSY